MNTKTFIFIISICISSHLFGQIEVKTKIDTLKIIQPENVFNALIEYNYRDFSEPIYFNKTEVIEVFKQSREELTTMERFDQNDSTRVPYSLYLELKKCIDYLTNTEELVFSKEKAVGFPEELSNHDLTDRYLEDVSCTLLDQGKFGFGAKSKYLKRPIIKAQVYETARYYGTESIKFYVGEEVICTCPPITHAHFEIE